MKTTKEKLELIAETLEIEPFEMSEDLVLTGHPNWDSMAKLSFIVMMEDEFGSIIQTDHIKKLTTVRDILALMGE